MIFNMGGGVVPKNTMPYNLTLYPNTFDQTYPKGTYFSKGVTFKGDNNFIAENIKKDVSMFGLVGTYEGSSGVYAWKKYSTDYHDFAVGKAEIIFTYSRGYHYKLTSANFDLSQIDNETYVDVLDGFEIGNVHGFRIALLKSGRRLYYTVYSGNSSIQQNVADYVVDTDGSVNIFLTGYWSGNGQTVGDTYTALNTVSKTLYSTNLVGYAVSDDGSKYPDGGVVDGYFYELVTDEEEMEEIIVSMTAENFGMSKIAFGEFTCASLKNTSEYTINHNLGTTPTFAMIMCDANKGASDDGLLACMRNSGWGVICIDGYLEPYGNLNVNPEAKDYLELTANTMRLVYGTRISAKFKAGVTYRYVVGV